MRCRLKDEHPVMLAVKEIEEIMTKHGITIESNNCGGLRITHNNGKDTYNLRDLDDGTNCYTFPWPFESVITFDKD